MKKILTLLLSIVLITTAFPSIALADTSTSEVSVKTDQTETTIVNGLNTNWSKKANATIKNTITISPSYGRAVELQMYDKNQCIWQCKKTFTANQNSEGDLIIVYPSNWTQKQNSQWRIYMPETSDGSEYISNTITIITKNRKTLSLSAKSAIIINAENGDVLYDKKMNTKRQNASTTKIMTAILALENSSLKTKVKISKKAAKTPDRSVHFKKGDKVYMKNLLNCLLIESDNGSAVAIAEAISGSKSKFAKKMNNKAKALGCTKTHFVNPHGWPNKKHYSTAHDLALMTQHAIKKSYFRKVVKKKSHSFKTLKKKDKFKVKTTNKLLGKVKGVTGAKTGTTRAAGYCFVGTYKYKGKTYITVVLNSGSEAKRWKDTKKLIGYVKAYE